MKGFIKINEALKRGHVLCFQTHIYFILKTLMNQILSLYSFVYIFSLPLMSISVGARRCLLPVAGCLLEYLLSPLFKQQHSPLRLIQQVSDMDPQVFGLVSSGHLPPGASVGFPNLYEQLCRLRHYVWQERRTVPQAQPGVGAHLEELQELFQGLV